MAGDGPEGNSSLALELIPKLGKRATGSPGRLYYGFGESIYILPPPPLFPKLVPFINIPTNMDDPAALDLDKPIGFFTEELNVTFTQAFQTLGNAIADKTLQKEWEVQLKKIPNLKNSFKQKKTLGQRAYLLVYSSLTNACAAICRRHHNLFTHKITLDKEPILEQYLNAQLNNLHLQIDETFFSNPRALPILEKFVPVFKHWLEEYGQLTSIQAHNLSQGLPHQFFGELIRTWNQRPKYFQPIHKFLSNNPFLDTWRQEQAWADYYARLQSLYTAPVFGDEKGMTLADIYVEPDFAVHERSFREKDKATQ